jgi:hypothetical protein
MMRARRCNHDAPASRASTRSSVARGGREEWARLAGEIVTSAEFIAAQKRIGLSSAKLALELGFGKHGGKTIRRYKSGERKVPDVVALAMMELERKYFDK